MTRRFPFVEDRRHRFGEFDDLVPKYLNVGPILHGNPPAVEPQGGAPGPAVPEAAQVPAPPAAVPEPALTWSPNVK